MALLLDIAWIVLFAMLGRRSHGTETGLVAVAATAGPFLAGYAVAIAITRLRTSPSALGRGAVAVAITLVIGMAIRTILYGRVPDPAFIVVATVVLAAGMLGWRVVALVWRRRRPTAAEGGG